MNQEEEIINTSSGQDGEEHSRVELASGGVPGVGGGDTGAAGAGGEQPKENESPPEREVVPAAVEEQKGEPVAEQPTKSQPKPRKQREPKKKEAKRETVPAEETGVRDDAGGDGTGARREPEEKTKAIVKADDKRFDAEQWDRFKRYSQVSIRQIQGSLDSLKRKWAGGRLGR